MVSYSPYHSCNYTYDINMGCLSLPQTTASRNMVSCVGDLNAWYREGGRIKEIWEKSQTHSECKVTSLQLTECISDDRKMPPPSPLSLSSASQVSIATTDKQTMLCPSNKALFGNLKKKGRVNWCTVHEWISKLLRCEKKQRTKYDTLYHFLHTKSSNTNVCPTVET